MALRASSDSLTRSDTAIKVSLFSISSWVVASFKYNAAVTFMASVVPVNVKLEWKRNVNVQYHIM